MPTIIRRSLAWGIMAGSIAITAYYLMLSTSSQSLINIRSMRHFWNNMGWYSIFLGLVAVVLWKLKKSKINSQKNQGTAINAGSLLMLRDMHILSGWVAFVFGLGHAAFYLLTSFSRVKYTDTGIVVTILMFILMELGVLYQYKVIKIPLARKLHRTFSIICALVMLVHI